MLRICNPSATLPGRTMLSTTVLDRLSSAERNNVSSFYDQGAYVRVFTDGCLTPSGEKLMGFGRLMRSFDSGKVCTDVLWLQEVTKPGENDESTIKEIECELHDILDHLKTDSYLSLAIQHLVI